MASNKIFIVEDNEWFGELLEFHMALNPENEILRFINGKDLLKSLYLKPDIITLDYDLPDYNGLELLTKIREVNSSIEVIIISGQEEIKTAVELLKLGAYDYIVKGDDTQDKLWNCVSKINEKHKLLGEIETLREEVGLKYSFENSIIGTSPAIKSIFSLIEKACKTNITVSISGETGTGKELVAKSIHYNSDRAKKPFIAINMSAIPRELVESELFGSEKGAFTGAVTRRIGAFEQANSGTLFLDEIGEMDINTQSKILRVLQERELTRVGGTEHVKLDVRIIVATHKNLLEEIKQKKFREDLYYRILGLPIELPPLRARGNDIIILAKFFIDGFCKSNKLKLKTLSSGAKEKLLNYSYPGNIRELKAIVEFACVLTDNQEISAEDIKFHTIREEDSLLMNEYTLAEYEIHIIKHHLKKNDDNVVLTAKKLGIGKSKIYNMISRGEISLDH